MPGISVSRMHRQVAATVFVVVGLILPTLGTFWWALSVNRPGHVRDVEVRLSRELGLQVGLEGVAYPRPGEIVLLGAVFRQEEPRGRVFREVARAKRLSLKPQENGYLLEGPELNLVGDDAETAMGQLGQLIQKASTNAGSIKRLVVAVDRCQILVENGAGHRPVKLDWRGVAGTVESRPEQTVVKASGWMHQSDQRTRCELELTRKRLGEKAETHVTLATVEGPALPATVLEPLVDTPGWLGDVARVQGQLTLTQVDSQPWQARFAGTLDQVDFSRLINNRFGSHRLAAQGQIQIRQAAWGDRPGQGPGWREIDGDLTMGPGSVSHSLFLAMGQQMQFRLAEYLHKSNQARGDVAFGSLGLQFHLTDDGRIAFGGACGPDFAPDVVAVSNQAKPVPIMAAPASAANVRGLMKTLFPVNLAQAELLVPATRESQALQRYLPMPAARLEKSQVLPTKHE